MITAGSVRGKWSLPSAVQARVQPACDSIGRRAAARAVRVALVPLLQGDRRDDQRRRRDRRRARRSRAASPTRRLVRLDGRSEVRHRRRPRRGSAAVASGGTSAAAREAIDRASARRPAVADFGRDRHDAGTRPRVGQPRVVGAAVRHPVERGRRSARRQRRSRPTLRHPSRPAPSAASGPVMAAASPTTTDVNRAGAKNSAAAALTSSTVDRRQPAGVLDRSSRARARTRRARTASRRARPASPSTARACRSRTGAPRRPRPSVTGNDAIRPSS